MEPHNGTRHLFGIVNYHFVIYLIRFPVNSSFGIGEVNALLKYVGCCAQSSPIPIPSTFITQNCATPTRAISPATCTFATESCSRSPCTTNSASIYNGKPPEFDLNQSGAIGSDRSGPAIESATMDPVDVQ